MTQTCLPEDRDRQMKGAIHEGYKEARRKVRSEHRHSLPVCPACAAYGAFGVVLGGADR